MRSQNLRETNQIRVGESIDTIELPATRPDQSSVMVVLNGGFALHCWKCGDALAAIGWDDQGNLRLYMGEHVRDFIRQPIRIDCDSCGSGNNVNDRTAYVARGKSLASLRT